ncbi:cell death activator CIDE-A isoform X2 [Melanotaenia boesemani]|uniref:cell death activator CIDE-A isoform X2 n=1 Tax=Melanotaenia boesemani TaxID=1250792 RepID=UPI001C05A842|nr:cell death activator CIDE-A isoform X2 [Melanotaenia boesemani]
MAPLSIQSGVNYAKTLLPETLMRSVSTVQTTISRRILPSSQPRCYRVCTHSRRRRRNLLASSLDELLEQAETVFMMSRYNFLTLVLEEDGAVVDSEEFFQSLPSNIPLMVLDKGEMWTENKILPSFREPKKSGIAKLTFDLYKIGASLRHLSDQTDRTAAALHVLVAAAVHRRRRVLAVRC